MVPLQTVVGLVPDVGRIRFLQFDRATTGVDIVTQDVEIVKIELYSFSFALYLLI